jgi:hypothetical protein
MDKNMKTAEEYLQRASKEQTGKDFYWNWQNVGGTAMFNIVNKAMKAYALAAIEQDRKDCAFRLTNSLLFDGIMVPDSKIVPVILDRPLPDLK